VSSAKRNIVRVRLRTFVCSQAAHTSLESGIDYCVPAPQIPEHIHGLDGIKFAVNSIELHDMYE
jgi:hypothetical protein